MRVTVQLRSWVQKINPALCRIFLCTILIYYIQKVLTGIYVGHSEAMEQCLQRHNAKQVPSTKAYVPWKLVYTENYPTRSEASARELDIKKKKVGFILKN